LRGRECAEQVLVAAPRRYRDGAIHALAAGRQAEEHASPVPRVRPAPDVAGGDQALDGAPHPGLVGAQPQADLVRADAAARVQGVDHPPLGQPHAEAPRVIARRGQRQRIREDQHPVRQQGAQQARVIGSFHAAIVAVDRMVS